MFLRIIISLIIILPISVKAEWVSINKVDEFTDEKVSYATYSDDKHQIQLSREHDAVWMFITILNTASFEPKGVIELRVDKNAVLTVDPVKRQKLAKILGRPTFNWEPKTVGFLVWSGNEIEGCGYIGELLNGEILKGRYQINSMEKNTFNINLDGAKEAIKSGLGLEHCGK